VTPFLHWILGLYIDKHLRLYRRGKCADIGGRAAGVSTNRPLGLFAAGEAPDRVGVGAGAGAERERVPVQESDRSGAVAGVGPAAVRRRRRTAHPARTCFAIWLITAPTRVGPRI